MSLAGRIIIGWWIFATAWVPLGDSRGFGLQERQQGGLKEYGGALGWPRASTASVRRVKAPLLACCKGGVAFCRLARRCHLDNLTGCDVEAVRANTTSLCDHLQDIQLILLEHRLCINLLRHCGEDIGTSKCASKHTADRLSLSRCPEDLTQ